MTAPIPAPPAVPAQEPTAPPAPPAAPAAPPWGTDDQFDPAKAWSLIEGLRADKEKLSARPVLTPEQQQQLTEYQALVEASKTEAQRLAEATEAAKREAADAKADAARYKAAATYGISPEHFDLLGTGSEEEVAARAAKLAALLTPSVPPAPGAPPTRPVEQLRPGATPAGQPNDDDVVYAALFGPPK
jgi:hypothetical protein